MLSFVFFISVVFVRAWRTAVTDGPVSVINVLNISSSWTVKYSLTISYSDHRFLAFIVLYCVDTHLRQLDHLRSGERNFVFFLLRFCELSRAH